MYLRPVMCIPVPEWQQDIARGRAFEAFVRSAWRGAGIWPSGEEQFVRTAGRKGYIDLWDDAAGLLVICELKSVDWKRRREPREVMRTVQRHRNQLLGYLVADGMPDDTQLVLIYDAVPEEAVRDMITAYLEEWSINLLWWDDDTADHWLVPRATGTNPATAVFPAPEERVASRKPSPRGRTRVVERVTVGRPSFDHGESDAEA